MLGVKHAIAHMKEHGGAIINMCSIAGLICIANLYAYNAAKGAVRLLTKSAALYCAQQGYPIRINSIHPGYTRTLMVDAYSQMRGDLEKLHPMGRLGSTREIANMALYLASDDSSFSLDPSLLLMAAIRRNDKNAVLQSTLSNGRPDYDEMLDGRASIAAYIPESVQTSRRNPRWPYGIDNL